MGYFFKSAVGHRFKSIWYNTFNGCWLLASGRWLVIADLGSGE
jgi:hypothetical protein